MSGLQLMIPPFVACMVLVAMLSYLGLHVIAREVIFVDLSLAQMAALGSLTALLIHVRSEEHTLNSSHLVISYAVFCLKKKNETRFASQLTSGSITGFFRDTL